MKRPNIALSRGVDEEAQYSLVSGRLDRGQQLSQLFLREGLDDLLRGARYLESDRDIGLQVALLLGESEEGLQSAGLALDGAWGEASLLTMVEPCPEVADTQL